MVNLSIDFSESLERVEGILTQELPKIHETLCGLSSDPVSGPNYIGVTNISDYGVQLSFTVFCMGKDVYALTLALNRELKLMCERNGIVIAHHMYTNSPVKVLKIESKWVLETVHTNASIIMANKMKPAKTMSSLS